MLNLPKFLLLTTPLFILVGCQKSIDMNNYINKNLPLDISMEKFDSISKLTTSTYSEIAVNTPKYLRLINWLDKNKSGWQSTPASYIGNIDVHQGSFNLLYSINGAGVVVSFNDKQNKAHQYSKTIQKGELDFLITN